MTDLATRHEPVSDLFDHLNSAEDRQQYRLSDEQVAFFHENGYISGIRILSDEQCDALCEQLQPLFTPDHPGREHWYEYHTNESPDPTQVLFHALGAWRITPAFMTSCGIPPSPSRPASCSTVPSGSGTTSCSASRRITAVWSPGTRTTRTGRERSPWHT